MSTQKYKGARSILRYNPCSTIHSNRAEADVLSVTGTQAYTQTVTFIKILRPNMEATTRANSPDRYTLTQVSLALRPRQNAALEVVLREREYAARRKATQAGWHDILHTRVTALPLWTATALPHLPDAVAQYLWPRNNSLGSAA